MLVEFKVQNFRSIRDEQVFSLVASNYEKELPDNVISFPLPGLTGVKALKGAAIYGANASGKSNLLYGLMFLDYLVENSATKMTQGDSIDVEPFLLDPACPEQPSRFEVTFVAGGTRYKFGIAVNRTRVLEEFLIAFPKGIAQRWYHRRYDPEEQAYVWSKSGLFSDRGLKNKVRENSLLLSVGPQFNLEQLSPVFDWFKSKLRFISLSGEDAFGSGFTTNMLRDNTQKARILEILKHADFGVVDVEVDENEPDFAQMREILSPKFAAELEERFKSDSANRLDVRLCHASANAATVPLNFDLESAGTRRFYSLIGPWLDIADNGRTVLVDEVDTSLHPLLVRQLLSLLFRCSQSRENAQIIFTTHNPVLLDTSLLRRDQIWFTEKGPNGETHLYPLTDFQPRKREAIAKGYLAGRYGAIPFLPHGLGI